MKGDFCQIVTKCEGATEDRDDISRIVVFRILRIHIYIYKFFSTIIVHMYIYIHVFICKLMCVL